MLKSKLLLVEDDASQMMMLSMDLKRRDFDVVTVRSGNEAIAKLGHELFDVVVTDLRLEGTGGLDVLKTSKKIQPETEVIVITGHGSVDTAVAAIKAGAHDYLMKPVDPEELYLVIKKAMERRSLLGEVRRLRAEARAKYSFEGIVYVSQQMQKVLDLVRKVAATEATVLILGESGTGKELIARAIHENSSHRNGAFVAINCGALPEGLLESELFGHVKGSFTGADRNKRGLFEEADGGSLFLDEISETTPALQVKLLRALQEGEIRRVGDNHPFKVSPRLMAASNKNLTSLVQEGKFRDDLYYRLKVFPIEIPPLRERPEDVLPLAEHFLRKARKALHAAASRFSAEAAHALKFYRWPGNVRELEHMIERALIMASSPVIAMDDLPPELHTKKPPEAAPAAGDRGRMTLEDIEKTHILETLKSCQGNQVQAAKVLGIGRNTLWRKLRAYGIVVSGVVEEPNPAKPESRSPKP
ncbi:MAG: sigma-54-dependent Fis family transcriptional regulator [Elusimicrobia bacterium]|nr:sigma-54-dependent Fis family transcriptional regulator [Elusimicrobiota bacterium]